MYDYLTRSNGWTWKRQFFCTYACWQGTFARHFSSKSSTFLNFIFKANIRMEYIGKTHKALERSELVLSRIDRCKAPYVNVQECEVRRLQLLINTAARVESGRSRFDHITDFIRDDLHWLPNTQLVHFIACSLVFKAIQGLAPNYITDFIVRSTVVPRRRDLRSSAALQLIPPSHRRNLLNEHLLL